MYKLGERPCRAETEVWRGTGAQLVLVRGAKRRRWNLRLSSRQVRALPAPLPGDPCSVGWLLLQADQVRLKGSDQKCRYVWGRDQQASVECATQAWEKYNSEKDIVAHIKKDFDKKYNPTWHCIVGRNLSSSRTKKNKHFIHSFGPSGHSSVQIWLKAWTMPHTQWSIQKEDHSPHSKHQRLQSSVGPTATPLETLSCCFVHVSRAVSVLISEL